MPEVRGLALKVLRLKRRAGGRAAHVLGVSLLIVPMLTLGGSWFTRRVALAPGPGCAAPEHLERARTPPAKHRFREVEAELRVPERSPLVAQRDAQATQPPSRRLQALIASARRELAGDDFYTARVDQKRVLAMDPKAGHALAREIGAGFLAFSFHHSPPVVHEGAAADPTFREAWPEAFRLFEKGDFEHAAQAFDAASASGTTPRLRDVAHVLASNVRSCAHLLGNASGRTSRSALNVCSIVDAQGAAVTRARALLAKIEDAEALESLAKGQTDDAQELIFASDSHLTALDLEPDDPDAPAYVHALEAAAPALVAGARGDFYRAKRTWMALALGLPKGTPLHDRALEELAKICDH